MTRFSIFAFVVLSIILISGCPTKSNVRQPDEIGPGGKPVLGIKTDPEKQGEKAIEITEEISYPGMTSYEGAPYQYLASELPEKVAKWFEDNLKGANVEQRTGQTPTETEWIIKYKDLIIWVAYGPNQTDTLIQYKKELPLSN